MEWSTELSLKLIDEYKNCSILWNTKHPFYFSRNDKLNAWNRISENLNISVPDAKQKINSLLGSLRREKAKGRIRIGKGSGAKEVYASKWFAFKQMSFLLDRREPGKVYTEDDSRTDQTSFEEYDHTQFLDVAYKTESSQHSVASEEAPSGFSEADHFLSLMPANCKIEKTSIVDDDARCEEAYNILKETVAAASQDSDPCSIYGKHVANKLRTYTHRTRAEVENAINQILYAADVGKYDDVPSAEPYPESTPRIET